jgi:hypothetical protein
LSVHYSAPFVASTGSRTGGLLGGMTRSLADATLKGLFALNKYRFDNS